MPVPALVDADLATRQFSVRARDVVFVKGVLEASEGLGVLFGERGGELTLATPKSRLAELDRLLQDLQREIGGVLEGAASLDDSRMVSDDVEPTALHGVDPS